jgi:hypothetical protein
LEIFMLDRTNVAEKNIIGINMVKSQNKYHKH